MDLWPIFDDLVRFETDLCNGVDARLREAGAVPLGSLDVLQVVRDTPACRVNDIADAPSITIGGASRADRRSSIVELAVWFGDAMSPAVLRTLARDLSALRSAGVDRRRARESSRAASAFPGVRGRSAGGGDGPA